jgi:dipeptidyl-peptidase-4
MNKNNIYLVLFTCVSMASLSAQTGNNSLTLNDIVAGKYAARGISAMQALPDGAHYTMLSPNRKAIVKYAYQTGRAVDTLFHVDRVRETRLPFIEGYQIDSRGYRILVWNEKEPIYRRSWQADVYDYDVRRNFLKPLSDTSGKIRVPTFSPDGRMVAFVRDNNIWLKKLDYDTESQLTTDGCPGKILNGITDWVYEEEFSQTHLISWSADSRWLAFVRSDETETPSYAFQRFDGSLYPTFHTYKYPKAGQPNSKVSCHAYNIETKDTKKMDIPLDDDGYIPAIRFTDNPNQLAVMTLNRHQNHFRMYFVDPRSTLAKQVLSDRSNYYIDSDWILSIAFAGNRFAYVSEQDGFAHIYLYSITGTLEKQLTSGQWDVTALYGIHPTTHTVYYQSAEESPLRRSVYKTDVKGKTTRLSSETGTNRASFSADFNYLVNFFSNTTTPNRITICNSSGKELCVLNDNATTRQRLSEVRIPAKTFFSFTNPDGIELNGWIIPPAAFDASKKYPLLMLQYSGPGSQEVLDHYEMDWFYALAEQGYFIASVDGRGTGARGEAFRKCTYLQLGILESDDQIAAARHLARHPGIDPQRIAIWGWSFGGFNTLMCLSRGNGAFAAGIAIAPVTDWRYYDSIYTERFMRTPNENHENYELTSPIHLASHLQGNLLLIHGTADDNVHFQNTVDYAAALVEAGKKFDMQIYANKNHSLTGTPTRLHLYTRIIDFLQKNN